ncbi:MAG: translocase [Planctomycetota bacterium]|nr:translocase [Planctomycetota bacterium]MDA1249195.1 translocase [Planctomycetota bacterium]
MLGSVYHLSKSLGRPQKGRLSRWRAQANRILQDSRQLKGISDQELLDRAKDVQWRAKTGIPLHTILEEVFCLGIEASRRTLGMEHYAVQIMGGIAMFEGGVAELQTGEGKTLSATLPALLRALVGKGSHIVTVNDYLAERDAAEMTPLYGAVGLTTGCILTPMESDERRENYARDITYGTAKEFGFDLLRDRLKQGVAAGGRKRRTLFSVAAGGEAPVQRGHHAVIIDEADSILIDEARTPLIIGLTMPNDASTVSLFRWCHRAVSHLEANVDFVYEPERRSAYLTDQGCRKVLLLGKPALIDSIDTERIYKHVEQALTAKFAFVLDRDYVVVDNEISIVDEGTGRIMEGRKWQDGLHQSIEAKELVPITAASGEAARITVQNFFRLYTYISGMTGTAVQCSGEIRKVYGLKVTAIPTHRPCIRKQLTSRVFANNEAKWRAIIDDIDQMVKDGRAILIGTPSVDASETLGRMMRDREIPHNILNARYHEEEAEIISKAGECGKVTVATNMAGRGTDIKLTEDLTTAGGLHVIATEMHSSKRIDRQLVGRSARQGDPGSCRFYLSLEDELLRVLTPEKMASLRKQATPNKHGELMSSWLSLFQKTQRKLEKLHYKQRKDMMKQDKHRTESYRRMGLDPCLELTEN